MTSAPAPLAPTARFLRYWLVFLALFLTPIAVGVPWLADALAQTNFAAAGLVAIHYGVLTKPLRHGWLAVVRGGVTVFALVVVMVVLVAAVYVARHGAPLTASEDLLHTVSGIAGIAIAHLAAVAIASRLWPAPPPTDANLSL